jgi:hypothetical protein
MPIAIQPAKKEVFNGAAFKTACWQADVVNHSKRDFGIVWPRIVMW